MKANKRFVTVLLAALTIFVLVPSMAFAKTYEGANVGSWDAKYAGVTDTATPAHHFDTARTFSDGLIAAKALDDKSIIGDVYYAPGSTGSDGVTAYYYDLESSTLAYNGKSIDGTTWTQEAFDQMLKGDSLKVQLIEPKYTEKFVTEETPYSGKNILKKEFPITGWKASSANEKVFEGSAALTSYTLAVETSEYESGLTEDQKVTISVKEVAIDEGKEVAKTPTAEVPDVDGAVAQATVTVKAHTIVPNEAKYYLDSTDSVYSAEANKLLAGFYDGAAHTVVCDEVPGYTVAYSVLNATTGKWEAVNAVTITDVQDKPMKVKATFTKTADKSTVDKQFTLNMLPMPLDVSFDAEQSVVDVKDFSGYIFRIPGTEYKGLDFIAAAFDPDTSKAKTDAEKAIIKAYNAAGAKALAANAEQLKAYFAEKYDVVAKAPKNVDYMTNLTIEAKDITIKEGEAVDKKYEALLRNIAVDIHETAKAALYFNNGVIDYEVEFVDTPTAMKFKAKKLKKKAASFTVTAVAGNGATVQYKLIDAPAKIKIDKTTGKVTLAKKLKKGTYKVKVKAYIPGVVGNEFNTKDNAINFYEIQNIKIKVK